MDFIWSCALSRCETGRRSRKHHMGEMLLHSIFQVRTAGRVPVAELRSPLI